MKKKKFAFMVLVIYLMSVLGESALALSSERIANGSFDALGGDGYPVMWGKTAECYTETTGTNSMFRLSGENPQYISQTVYEIKGGAVYSFSGDFKGDKGSQPAIKVTWLCRAGIGGAYTISEIYKNYSAKLVQNAWVNVTEIFSAPDDAEMMQILVRKLGPGTLYWDNVSFIGDTGDISYTEYENKPPMEGAGEIFTDGDFRAGLGSFTRTSGVTLSDGRVKMSGTGDYLGLSRSFYPEEGYEYQVSMALNMAASAIVRIKFVHYNSGGEIISEYYSGPFDSKPGAEAFVSELFTAPKDCRKTTVTIRLMSAGEVYVDNVSCYKTAPPQIFELTTDQAFYYSDLTGSGTATLAPTEFYSGFEGKAEFTLLDGSTELISSGKLVWSGELSFEFSLSLLELKKHEYSVRAVIYNADNSINETKNRKIYKYDRPACLNERGEYTDLSGNVVIPKFLYGASTQDFPAVKSGGINVVQSQVNAAAISAAQANGLKLLGVLYFSMLPAGHGANEKAVRNIVNTYKDSPHIYGWLIMDEPYYNLGDKTDLLMDSYKLVRDIDSNHPVFLMQDSSKYYKKAAACTDILGIDPYVGSNDIKSHVASKTAEAVSAAAGIKPVYTLLQAFEFGNFLPSGEDVKYMAYQALCEGARGIGLFTYPELRGTELWNDFTGFVTELDTAYKGIVSGNEKNSDTGDAYIRSWRADGNDYILGVNKTAGDVLTQLEIRGISKETHHAEASGSGNARVLYEKVRLNVSGSSAAFFRVSEGAQTLNYIEYGDFENETGWSFSDSGAVTYASAGDNTYLRIVAASGTPYGGQNISNIEKGRYYSLSFDSMITLGLSPYVKIEIPCSDSSGTREMTFNNWKTIPIVTANKWEHFEIIFYVPKSASAVNFLFRGTTAAVYSYDNISLTDAESFSGMYKGVSVVGKELNPDFTPPAVTESGVSISATAIKGTRLSAPVSGFQALFCLIPEATETACFITALYSDKPGGRHMEDIKIARRQAIAGQPLTYTEDCGAWTEAFSIRNYIWTENLSPKQIINF